MYQVKGVKEHKGHEGEPLFQCRLYRDNKAVAEYSDGDWGGPSIVRWLKDGEEDLLNEHVKGMTRDNFRGDPVPLEPDMFISNLIDIYLCTKQLKKIMKNSVVFIDDDKCFDIKVKKGMEIDERHYKVVSQKYPGADILNSKPIEEAVELFMEYAK